MNKQRFINYVKYDLTINRSFYRNAFLTCLIIFSSISIVTFLLQWAMDDTVTLAWLAWIMMAWCAMAFQNIFAGCVNHPLRNKQGRISTLTLPASNAEKFLWHMLVTIVGGSLTVLAGFTLADLINALFSWLVKLHPIQSYLAMLMFNFPDDHISSSIDNYKALLIVLAVTSQLSSMATFTFGNAIKWRYNIILTILALWIIQTVATVVCIISVLCIPEIAEFIDQLLNIWTGGYEHLEMPLWTYIIINLAYAAVLFWMSWVRYERAAITNRFNR